MAAGFTGVGAAGLRISELRKYRDEARVKAIRAAKEKAVALAAELGAKVGKPYGITEGADCGWQFNAANNMNSQVISAGVDPGAAGTQPTFATGTVSVTAIVTVDFPLE